MSHFWKEARFFLFAQKLHPLSRPPVRTWSRRIRWINRSLWRERKVRPRFIIVELRKPTAFQPATGENLIKFHSLLPNLGHGFWGPLSAASHDMSRPEAHPSVRPSAHCQDDVSFFSSWSSSSTYLPRGREGETQPEWETRFVCLYSQFSPSTGTDFCWKMTWRRKYLIKRVSDPFSGPGLINGIVPQAVGGLLVRGDSISTQIIHIVAFVHQVLL